MKEIIFCGICGCVVGQCDGSGLWVYKRGNAKRWYHYRCFENEQKEIRRNRYENGTNIKS